MSPYRKACDKARDAASALGHDLAQRWEVEGCRGRIRCTRCNASCVVIFDSPPHSFGAAIEDACKEGNVKVGPEMPETPPSNGKALEAPTVATFGRREKVPVLAGSK